MLNILWAVGGWITIFFLWIFVCIVCWATLDAAMKRLRPHDPRTRDGFFQEYVFGFPEGSLPVLVKLSLWPVAAIWYAQLVMKTNGRRWSIESQKDETHE